MVNSPYANSCTGSDTCLGYSTETTCTNEEGQVKNHPGNCTWGSIKSEQACQEASQQKQMDALHLLPSKPFHQLYLIVILNILQFQYQSLYFLMTLA